MADEVSHNPWRLPSMRGETEAYPFLFLQRKFIPALSDKVRNEKQFLSDGLRYLRGCPSRISCTSEIEYHLVENTRRIIRDEEVAIDGGQHTQKYRACDA